MLLKNSVTQRAVSGRAPVAVRASQTESEPSTSVAVAVTPAVARYTNVGPDPKRFSVGEGQLLAVAGAALPMLTRLGSGALCYGYKTGLPQDDGKYGVIKVAGRKVAETSEVAGLPRPAQPLELYEFEGCPFCKKVREAMSILDLDVLMHPTPKGGEVWRSKVQELGGKQQYPFLVDPNTGKQMYESDDIINYLFSTYGPGAGDKVPRMLRLGTLTTLTAGLGLLGRGGRGNRAVPSKQPAQPLVFWGYDPSPFVKVVREVLCEMQLPYLYKNVARGSPRRQELLDKYGHFQVPCLEDPNTQSYLFESSAICRYLQYQYGVDNSSN